MNLWFIVPKNVPKPLFPIPLVNHCQTTNFNFERYGDHSQRG